VAGQSQVDRAAMAQAAQKLDEAVGTTRGIRSNLQGHKGELLGQWEGQAAMAFNRVFEQFDMDFAKVLDAMQGMQEKLVQTQQMYSRTEEEQTATVNSVANIINNP
jgi:WXG100 family type VII secretion target